MELAKEKGLWLIVKITDGSSAGCSVIDDTSWRSPEVSAWIVKNSFVVHVSVERDSEIARMLDTRAAPTFIAFWAGVEKERDVGLRDATELARWLDTLGGGPDKPDIGLRLSSAKIQLDDHHYDNATKRYVWLWNNIPSSDPTWMGVRVSSVANEIRSLVFAHPPARIRFTEVRDSSGTAAVAFDSGDWFGPRVDWIALNRVLGEEERTVNWFDSVKADPISGRVIEHVAPLLLGPLKERGRWADIGRLFCDPTARLVQTHEVLTGEGLLGPDTPTSTEFRSNAALLYTALLAAGRANEAKTFQQEALRLDPSDEMKRALEQANMLYR